MAQERNLGTARAADTTSTDDRTKAELQRQMDEARDSISNTVNEIKDTVTNQYQYVKSSVSEALDWREQFKKRPIAWSAGALSVGFLLGYVVAGAVKGDEESGFDYAAGESLTTDSSTGIRYPPYSVRQTGSASRGQAYSSGTARTAYSSQSTAAERPSYSSGYQPEEQ